ncbi:MAG: hypothetical protein GEV06_00615 [Luteitalea sp.]|nr:hypothetical protein [Luteitalea sp.]
MSISDEPLTKDEYLRRLFAAKAPQRRKDAELPFEEKVAIVLALQGVSLALRNARVVEGAGDRSPSEPE